MVLAWNQADLTSRCIDSIRENTDVEYELVVVDNGSDLDARALAISASDLAITHGENLGFSKGMNSGLARSSGEYVAFVNNDTVLPPAWATVLLSDFTSHPRAGIVLPVVTAAGNKVSVRDSPGSDVITLRRFIDLPGGVVYVMRRDLISEIGGWDERYEVASREDLDLLFTVWCNDLDVVLDERVLVTHESSATANTQLADKDAIWQRNWEVFLSKWCAGDPSCIARTSHVSQETFTHNVLTAAIAAHWMGRWYEAWTAERTLRRQARRSADDTQSTSRIHKRSLATYWRSFRSRLGGSR